MSELTSYSFMYTDITIIIATVHFELTPFDSQLEVASF